MVNESAVEGCPRTSSLQWGRIAMITAAMTVTIVALLGGVAAAGTFCAPSSYAVISSAPPASANWTQTSGLWNPSGGYPGCAVGDSASDTNVSPTTITLDNTSSNLNITINTLNLACNGCVVEVGAGTSLTLSGPGTSIIGNGATLRINGGTLNVNAPLTLQSGARLELIDAVVAGSDTITSAGTVETTGGTTSSIHNALNTTSTGSVLATNGTLILYGGGNGDGPYTINTGATINLNLGTYTTTPNGVISGGGQLEITGASLTIGGVTTPAIFTLHTGTLDGPGFLSIGKSFYWDGGTIADSFGETAAPSSPATVSGSSPAFPGR